MNQTGKTKTIEIGEHTVKELEDILKDRLTRIIRIDLKRIEIEKWINNDNLFLDFNSKLKDFVLNTYKENKGNFLLFLRELRKKKPWIQNSKGELSEFILKQLSRKQVEFGDERHFSVLINLYNIIAAARSGKNANDGKNPIDMNYVISFIKTEQNRNTINDSINMIRNKKIAEQIRKAITDLIGEELDYLVRYSHEVHSWNSREVLREDLPFFSSKMKLFLYGQNYEYKGILSYFKDERLKKILASNAVFLQFIRYNQQLAYLEDLRNKISTSYQSGDWTQFYGFYNNIEKKTADILLNRFGNPELASEFLKDKPILHEDPNEWMKFFDKKLFDLRSDNYRHKIIAQLVRELEVVFNLRIRELTSMQKPGFSELFNSLAPLVKLEKNAATNILGVLKGSGKKTREKIQQLRYEFETLSDNCIDELYSFMMLKRRIIDNNSLPDVHELLNYAYGKSNNELKLYKLAKSSSIVKKLFAFRRLSRITAEIGANERKIIEMVARKDFLSSIKMLSDKMHNVETAYAELINFIKNKLGLFGISIVKQEKEVDYGRTGTSRAG